jgi:hypothetical protein
MVNEGWGGGSVAVGRDPSGYGWIVDRRQALAEVALEFHGLTMNGGFLVSFATAPPHLDEVVAAFDVLRLDAAANLIRAGIDLIPASGGADSDTRRTMIDEMPDGAAVALENLGDRYSALVSDTLLGAKIAEHATPREQPPRPHPTVPAMLAEYADNTVEWDAAMKASQVARANRLFTRNHHLYMNLRLSEDGRDGLWELKRHDHPAVREAAVTHSLPWHAAEGVRLLEEMEAAGSFNAKWVLREWRAGTLKLDW